MRIDTEDLKSWDKHKRIRFLNMISGARTPFLIASVNGSGISNLAIFNSVVHIGANPPLLGFIMRPLTVERHTYTNIVKNSFFTLNTIHEDFVDKAHRSSEKFASDVSEFDSCKLEPQLIGSFPVPFVKRSHIKLGMKFSEDIPIESNGTRLIIGHLEEIHMDEDVLDNDGHIQLESVSPIAISGLESYFRLQAFKRIKYKS